MKKSFKKLVACLIAVLMVVSSMPLTAIAASSTAKLAVQAVGVINNGGTRYSDGKINVANDGEDGNFTIGFWRYDLSEVKANGGTVTEASMTATLADSPFADNSEAQGLSFYYATQNADSLSTGSNSFPDGSSILGQGTGTHKELAYYYFGFNIIKTVQASELSGGAQISVDMVDAINKSVEKGLSSCTIMVVQQQAGQTGSTGGWTDTWINATTNAVNAKLENGSSTIGTTSIAPSTIGMIMTSDANNSGRLNTSTKDMNIVNDGESKCFSVGFWQYDLETLRTLNATAKSAPLNITIPQTSESECQGLTFYVATKGENTTLSDGYNQNTAALSGSVSTWQQNIIDAYGLEEIATVSKATIDANVNGTITVDIAAALNKSLENEKREKATVMVMQSNAGQTGGNGGWTDAHLRYDTTANTVNVTYEISIEDLDPGVQGLLTAISAYETKMAKVGGSEVSVYTNMPDAYESYVEACAALDAYRYGSNADSIDIENIAKELVANTTKMIPWTDDVTGNYTSQVPTFTQTSVSEMQQYPEAYSNIIYTELCKGGSYDTTNGDTSGAAVIFDAKSNTEVQVYYPNMILLYDGSSTGAKFPVTFMAKKSVNRDRYIYSVYPAVDTAPVKFAEKNGFVGANADIYSMYWETGLQKNTWRGGNNSGSGFNRLDFDTTYGAGTNYVGSWTGNPLGNYSANLGYAWGKGYWNAYSSIFKVNPDIDLLDAYGKDLGVKEVKPYWAWYGGSGGDSTTAKTYNSGEAMQDVKQASHSIYVLNYKLLMDAVKDTTTEKKLSTVSNYKEGGLADLIAAFDKAINYDLNGITLNNITAKGQEILDDVNALKTKPVADVDTTGYNNLITEFKASKKIIDKGNENNENYTEETWTPFAAKYNEALELFTSFYTDSNKKLSTSTAAALAEELNELRKALVLNKNVVDTATLEIIINNAQRIISLSNYYVDSTISETMPSLVTEAINAVWGSNDNYGYDSEKILDTEANRATVQKYADLILAEVNKAQFDLTANVSTTYGDYNISTALDLAATYESSKNDWSNYATLLSAVNEGKAFVADVPAVNGLVADIVENITTRYINAVHNIVISANTLIPSFTLMKNGTVVNKGDVITTSLSSTTHPDQYSFGWQHNTNMVLFKTEKSALTFNLPTSTYTSYNKAYFDDFETVIDAITLSANSDADAKEITSQTRVGAFHGWPNKDYGLTASDKRTYAGNLSIINNNVEITQSNFKIASKSNANGIGFDTNGQRITNEDTDFTDYVATAEGYGSQNNQPAWPAGISALNGTTTFNATTTLSTYATEGSADIKNGPAKVSIQVNTAATKTYLGILYMYRYAPTHAQNWTGYAFAKAIMDLNVGIVDVSTLFEKIAQLEDADFVATENNYTKKSWDDLLEAIKDAKSDIDYDKYSTYSDLVNECERRYQELFTAQYALRAPASNASLKTALANAKDAYENRKAEIEPSTWDQFETAYTTALSAYTGNYSDVNVRNYGKDEQDAIDAIANALNDAYNALSFVVDYTPVDDAVKALVAGITDNKYSYDSINAVLEAITNLEYFNTSAEDRLTHFDNETDYVAGLNTEATVTIPRLSKLLVESPVTTETVDAVKVQLRAAKNDPDAYDQDAITNALNKISITKPILVYNKTVKGIVYATQEEADAAVAEALSSISLKNYKVTRDGVDFATYPYGSEVTIPSADNSKVDWYYAAKSPSSQTDNKYMTTDTEITFVVKGDTDLTTKKANNTQTYKVSYVNGENSLVYAVDYVPAGTSINVGTLSTGESAVAPTLAYRTFANYTVNGATKANGDSLVVNQDTTIVANYDLQADQGTYSVYISNLTYEYNDLNFEITDLSYNDEISFTKGSADGEGYHAIDCYYQVNGETRKETDAGRDTDEGVPEVYAWLEVNADDIAAWKAVAGTTDFIKGTTINGLATVKKTNAKVVGYGSDYTFRVSKPNTVLMALDKTMFDRLKGSDYTGFYDSDNQIDSNGAVVTTQDQVVIVPNTKFSIVSQFVVPDGAKVIETGVLFTAKRGTTEASTLPLKVNNAGSANNIARIKSTSHTAANQYVVSVTSTSLAGQSLDSLDMRWSAYMIYKIGDTTYTIYSPETTPSNLTATL